MAEPLATLGEYLELRRRKVQTNSSLPPSATTSLTHSTMKSVSQSGVGDWVSDSNGSVATREYDRDAFKVENNPRHFEGVPKEDIATVEAVMDAQIKNRQPTLEEVFANMKTRDDNAVQEIDLT